MRTIVLVLMLVSMSVPMGAGTEGGPQIQTHHYDGLIHAEWEGSYVNEVGFIELTAVYEMQPHGYWKRVSADIHYAGPYGTVDCTFTTPDEQGEGVIRTALWEAPCDFGSASYSPFNPNGWGLPGHEQTCMAHVIAGAESPTGAYADFFAFMPWPCDLAPLAPPTN